uniref:Glycosyl transferase CAP10 domain-containing protein n=1 Tax=Aegilops tauschii subsp. strangulata TaxID=200361 RepID=A0A453SV90_AEGTS
MFPVNKNEIQGSTNRDWIKESKAGYKKSYLASLCTHRYKIYIEGSAWPVSEKYIIACD